jgi:hypothetical protein
MLERNLKKIAFACKKDQVTDLNEGKGNFSLSELKTFSINNMNIIIIILKYGIIENGALELMQ